MNLSNNHNDNNDCLSKEQRVVQHLMVVGFHHKRGCLVEFCYPPIEIDYNDNNGDADDDSKNIHDPNDPVHLPSSWQILASLAIPDGAHNYDSDTVFFHISDHRPPNATLFGVSCYRQIATKDLLVKSPDITRSSVQKAVIVLMNCPVFGLIEYKLDIITRVYFGERDFSKTQILVDAYNDLNRHISPAIINSPDILSGLSIRSLFVRFGTQVVTLFKLLLLEKKTIFLHSPIRELSSSILTLCSLIPGLIQEGMTNSAIVYNKISLNNSDRSNEQNKIEQLMLKYKPKKQDNIPTFENISKSNSCDNFTHISQTKTDNLYFEEKNKSDPGTATTTSSESNSDDDEADEAEIQARLFDLWNKPSNIHGLPLNLFVENAYLMPYFSISYFDLLVNDRIRSFIGGSSNQIFRRWQNNIDVFVVGSQIEIDCPLLRRALRPSTEDMHFISYLVRAILTDNDSVDAADIFDDSQQEFYEGSDEWIRMHFKSYLLHLLRCSLLDKESSDYRSFNPFFIDMFKQTFAYRYWSSGPGMENVTKDVEPIHPFSSNRLNYLKLRLTNLLLHRQEMLNQSINKVANVSGQALNQARTTVNSWLSNIGSSLQEKAREASVAASSSTWKSYIPTSITNRATQILSPNEISPSSIVQQHESPKVTTITTEDNLIYQPEESETSV